MGQHAHDALCSGAAPHCPCRKGSVLAPDGGDTLDEAYLLGVYSSIPFDWYARRYVELKMSYDF